MAPRLVTHNAFYCAIGSPVVPSQRIDVHTISVGLAYGKNLGYFKTGFVVVSSTSPVFVVVMLFRVFCPSWKVTHLLDVIGIVLRSSGIQMPDAMLQNTWGAMQHIDVGRQNAMLRLIGKTMGTCRDTLNAEIPIESLWKYSARPLPASVFKCMAVTRGVFVHIRPKPFQRFYWIHRARHHLIGGFQHGQAFIASSRTCTGMTHSRLVMPDGRQSFLPAGNADMGKTRGLQARFTHNRAFVKRTQGQRLRIGTRGTDLGCFVHDASLQAKGEQPDSHGARRRGLVSVDQTLIQLLHYSIPHQGEPALCCGQYS